MKLYKLTNKSTFAISAPQLNSIHPIRIEPNEYLVMADTSLVSPIPVSPLYDVKVIKESDLEKPLLNGVSGTAFDKYLPDDEIKVNLEEEDFKEEIISNSVPNTPELEDIVIESAPQLIEIVEEVTDKVEEDSKVEEPKIDLSKMTKKEMVKLAKANDFDVDLRLSASKLRAELTKLV